MCALRLYRVNAWLWEYGRKLEYGRAENIIIEERWWRIVVSFFLNSPAMPSSPSLFTHSRSCCDGTCFRFSFKMLRIQMKSKNSCAWDSCAFCVVYCCFIWWVWTGRTLRAFVIRHAHEQSHTHLHTHIPYIHTTAAAMPYIYTFRYKK